MTKRERFERASALGAPDRTPFVPAIYEHKAVLIGRRPSEVCRDGDLLVQAVLREVEVYDPDAPVVGLDVYNVEAEALGCRVRYFEASNDVPAVAEPVVSSARDLGRLGLPDPEKDGRMPLFLEAARRLHRMIGRDTTVRGALTGPFSLACALAGTEALLVATVEAPEFVRKLVGFCGTVAAAYARPFLAAGLDVVLFDSKASPGAASPRVFREIVLPVYRDLVVPALSEAGARRIPMIIGGDTTPILDDLLETGATQLVCDAGADLPRFRKRCGEERRALRVSVDARLVHRGTPAAVRNEGLRILQAAGRQPGLLFGCGAVAYDTPAANVLALRASLDEWTRGTVPSGGDDPSG